MEGVRGSPDGGGSGVTGWDSLAESYLRGCLSSCHFGSSGKWE